MKSVGDLMIPARFVEEGDYITQVRQILRDGRYREVYAVNGDGCVVGYVDIADVLRITDTKSNVTVEGFLKEPATVRKEDTLETTGCVIRDYGTDSAAVVDEAGRGSGVILLTDLLPVLLKRHPVRGVAADIMSREVVSSQPDESIKKIHSKIIESGFTAFPVVKNGRVIGIISRTDIIRAGSVRHALRGDSDTTVERIMTTPPITHRSDDPLSEVAETFIRYNIGFVPVTCEGQVVGVIDRHDLLRTIVQGG
ncbi:MAG: CBS domain-containing protein [Methanoculleaceae archaeon]